MGEETVRPDLTAELQRLRKKSAETDDLDVRLAIEAQIERLETELHPREIEPAEDSEEHAEEDDLPVAPTPEEAAKAEQLIREARVEKMRGNKERSLKLMEEAAKVAPGSIAVLEALGDDLVERRQWVAARDTYSRAIRLDKKNIGLDRKFADAALRAGTTGSIEDQLRAGLSDSFLPTSADSLASVKTASLLNLVFPGLGHIVIGQTTTGIALFGAWVLMVIWMTFMRRDLVMFYGFIMGKAVQPNMLVLVPIFLSLCLVIGAVASLPKAPAGKKPKVDHPAPPVDLPFE